MAAQAAGESESVIQKAALPSLASPCLTRGMADDGGSFFLDIELTEMCHVGLAAVKISSSAASEKKGPAPFGAY